MNSAPLILHDKETIAAFLRRNVYLHIYSLGDLDDFFWPYTIWYAAGQNGEIRAIALLYTGLPIPNLLALSDDLASMRALIESVRHLLPRRFYSHLSPGLEAALRPQFQLESHGRYYKMALQEPARLGEVDVSATTRLTAADLAAIKQLYQVSYPGNWFDPRMLETKQYFGLKQNGALLSIAGIHVYSEAYRVAALGNITTHPDHRGRGFGCAVTARLCRSLLETVDHIGLNVNADNYQAVALYEKLGFAIVGTYDEFMIEAK